tara:strand:- start:203 stop:886 length:684 start_codon:yes stop_codon:yes gene_type:complete
MKKNIETELDLYIKKNNSNFFVVQIGANDGRMADPIYNKVKQYNWSGVFVEPVTYLFERLKQNYKGVNSNLMFENSVISNYTGQIDFYQFPIELEQNKDFPFWANGLGSILEPFNSPAHNNLKSKNFKMEKKKTPCLKFLDLVKKYNISKIDLLQIDVEGYDGMLLMDIDFTRIKPKFIRYEDKHINTAFKDGLTNVSSSDVISYLEKNGYEVSEINNGFDRICCLR